jgi:D-alanyl-D-alanine carboxypeptidase (penicillin-binding protein 5/6)
MEWGFRNFEAKKIYAAGQPVETAKVWLGKEEQVALVPREDGFITVPVARGGSFNATVKYSGPLEAPIRKGDAVANLYVDIPGQPPTVVELLAGQDVARAGLFGRVTARLHYLIYGS